MSDCLFACFQQAQNVPLKAGENDFQLPEGSLAALVQKRKLAGFILEGWSNIQSSKINRANFSCGRSVEESCQRKCMKFSTAFLFPYFFLASGIVFTGQK